MTTDTVGQGFEQDWTAAFFDDLTLAQDRVGNRQWVVTVDALGVHGIWVYTSANTGECTVGHGFTLSLATHAVEVIKEVKDDWQTTFVGVVPELVELVHRGEVEGFPNWATTHRGVTDVGDGQTRLAVDFLEQGGASSDVSRTTNDGVVGVDAEWGKEGVHRTTEALVKAGDASEDFSQGAIEQEIDGEVSGAAVATIINHGQDLAVIKGLHDVHQGGVVQLDGWPTCPWREFHHDYGATEDVVINGQVQGLTNGRSFLTDGQVSWAFVVVFDAFVDLLHFNFGQHGFEFTNDAHVFPDTDQLLIAVALDARRRRTCRIRRSGIVGDVELTASKGGGGIDV